MGLTSFHLHNGSIIKYYRIKESSWNLMYELPLDRRNWDLGFMEEPCVYVEWFWAYIWRASACKVARSGNFGAELLRPICICMIKVRFWDMQGLPCITPKDARYLYSSTKICIQFSSWWSYISINYFMAWYIWTLKLWKPWLLKKKGLTSLPTIPRKLKQCDACILGKYSKQSFHDSHSRAHRKIELIHWNLCGPMLFASANGNKYMMTFVDDYTRMCWVYILKNKFDAFETLKDFQDRKSVV